MPLRILLVGSQQDDQEIVRHRLSALLRAQTGWEVCGEARNGLDAVEQVRELQPEIVILDLDVPGLHGLEATRQILKANPQTKVLILTPDNSDQTVQEVLNAGARGFLLKADAARDLVAAVQALGYGRIHLAPNVSSMVLDGHLLRDAHPAAEPTCRRLTRREREVVQLVAEGKSSKQVAAVLGLSVKTAETHRSNIMRKLDLHSVSSLVLYAVRNNIVQVAQAAA